MVNDIAPGSIERRGIGPLSAAQTIVSFSHPDRRRNDAAFAALAGQPLARQQRPHHAPPAQPRRRPRP
jgi:hypothetical protein